MPFSLGMGRSQARSGSQSSSTGASVSGSSDSVFGADVFAQLFGDAGAAARGVNTDALTLTANRLFDSGAGFLDQLAELGGGGPVGAGEQALVDGLNGGDQLVTDQIAQLETDLGHFFTETLNPAMRSDAIATGGLGGTRQGVAEGMASQGLLREFASGALSIRQNAATTRNSVAQTLAQLQMQRRLSAVGAGLGALPQQFGLMEAGSMAALSPFSALADIIGDPTVLNDAFSAGYEESNSSSYSDESSRSFSFGIGGS